MDFNLHFTLGASRFGAAKNATSPEWCPNVGDHRGPRTHSSHPEVGLRLIIHITPTDKSTKPRSLPVSDVLLPNLHVLWPPLAGVDPGLVIAAV